MAWWRAVADESGRLDEAMARAGRVPSTVDRHLMLDPAETSGGDELCLGIEGAQHGSAWFWEHEFEADEDEEPDFRNIHISLQWQQ